MYGFKDLLLNLLFLLLPIFLYQTFWLDRNPNQSPRRNRVAICFLSLVGVSLCMTFPVSTIPGFVLDLRLVPLILGVLYGGYGTGVIVVLYTFLYRYLLGGVGTGFWLMMISFPLMLGAAFWLSKRFNTYSRKRKTLIATLLALPALIPVDLAVFAKWGYSYSENPHFLFMLAFTLVYLFSIWITVYLIENIRYKAMMHAEVQRAEKLDVLGQLAASIAHEIRNPMTVVRGFMQLMKENQIPAEKRDMFLSLSIDELDRSETIINNYLSFARPQHERIERIDVSARIRHVAEVMNSFALLHNVEIDLQLEDGLYIQGDPMAFAQVLMNLCKNGIEAMPSGGTLQLRSCRHRDRVEIDVIDSGIGLSKEETERLGDPFFTTKEKGTGLGLMVSYRIIHSINGQIEVNSEKGKGTRFMIQLPALV
ncbi:MAG TPA: ATP-binding protein [Bacilli bacterium]|nr:ATP-binding protein [Bacilli bacterium]